MKKKPEIVEVPEPAWKPPEPDLIVVDSFAPCPYPHEPDSKCPDRYKEKADER